MKMLTNPDKSQCAALREARALGLLEIIPCINFKGDAAFMDCREANVAFGFLTWADSHPLAYSCRRHVRHCHKLFDGCEFYFRDSKLSRGVRFLTFEKQIDNQSDASCRVNDGGQDG